MNVEVSYKHIRKLGSGGGGAVHQVRNNLFQRDEAWKMLSPDLAADPDHVELFQREFRILSRLNHPGVPTSYAIFTAGGYWYATMEYIDGWTLAELLDRRPLQINEVLQITSQALDALSYMHNAGVVHCDIKPANLMWSRNGQAKFIDFGVATFRQVDSRQLSGSTGTLSHMAPEALTNGSLDARSDLYSFGVVLYQLLTRRHPFNTNRESDLLAGHLHQIHTPPSQIAANVPAWIDPVLSRALEKNPDRRFQSAAEFLAALRA
jgi:eukaryotic-like serine/threonine-protein kinase